jgi:hypothetical protein
MLLSMSLLLFVVDISTKINPLAGGVIVWDSMGKTVQSRSAANIHDLQWQISNISQV